MHPNHKTLSTVAKRFKQICKAEGIPYDHTSTMMDLESVDAEFHMDWAALLAADAANQGHDLFGIQRHTDRSSYPGKLTGHFVPRFATGTK